MTMNVMIMANENEVEVTIVRENTITAQGRNLGPTASSLLETNNFLEAEVVRMRNELSCTSIRIRALENELRRDDAIKLVNSLKREIESMQAAVDLRLVDYKRMEYELSTVREKERMWKLEKVELERKLSEREAVFRAIESIKREFGGQLEQLNNQITGGRPPRMLSAPPLSDLCLPSPSQSPTTMQSDQCASTVIPTVTTCPSIGALTDITELELIDSYEDTETSECNVDIMAIGEQTLQPH
ncbi:unnamed protein product [Angiostrongylus costaricensis]|uniref:RH2 domain-containing protein n=1 Tax=Angiostrongylus costaricensis TaxID=334426 RepID=A0A158PF84_ANGCS|nr:unnamed protein product [Angiostrongylus costaricensis]